MLLAALVSFRLGGTDGVSIEAAKWCDGFRHLGFDVRTVAGEGNPDVHVAGLARYSDSPSTADVASALDGADVVIVENLLSLPLNPPASQVVAGVLRGRPAIVRHHDLPWQRPETLPPDRSWATVTTDSRWAHVVVNSISGMELAERGVDAVVLHNRFPLDGWDARSADRADGENGPLLLHPVRAIPRKNVPAALALAEKMDATYWLTGPAEDGYDHELASILGGARCPVRRDAVEVVAEAYAEAHAVVFPSTREGFGNPVIESALARRPLAVARYPVLTKDIEPFGFRWFDPAGAGALAAFVARPDNGLLDHNEGIARASFGLDRLPGELAGVLERVL